MLEDRSPRTALQRAYGLGRRLISPVGIALMNMRRSAQLYSLMRRARSPKKPLAVIGARTIRVTMIVVSGLSHDPRVRRGARALAARGYHVIVLCPPWTTDARELAIDWGPGIEIQLVSGTKIHRFPYLADTALYRAAIESRPDIIHCHDLNTCVIGLAASAVTGARCVCDFHEWFSENVVWDLRAARYVAHSALVRRLYQGAERLVMERATEVVTVCDSIANALMKRYPRREPVRVVRNIPSFEVGAPAKPLREQLGVSADTFILLYQGGVGPSRFLEPIIHAMAGVENAIFVIRGPGIDHYGPGYLELARSIGAEGRVVCLPPVATAEVVAAAASADAGIWTLEDLCLNFRYALPNKVFEYLTAMIPVLVADYPEVRRLVDRYGIGLCFIANSPDSIREAITRMQRERSFREECRRRIPQALADLDATKEWEKLVAIYDRISAPAT